MPFLEKDPGPLDKSWTCGSTESPLKGRKKGKVTSPFCKSGSQEDQIKVTRERKNTGNTFDLSWDLHGVPCWGRLLCKLGGHADL